MLAKHSIHRNKSKPTIQYYNDIPRDSSDHQYRDCPIGIDHQHVTHRPSGLVATSTWTRSSLQTLPVVLAHPAPPRYPTHTPATMSEATRPKYDNLPGIDTAPDIYETPDLAEDVSTIQASTVVSEDEDEETALDRQRFQTDQARSRFQPSRVDAQGVDFSDNIAAQRRSYRTSTRARRRRGEILGDDSDEEKESFGAKLQRVKAELMELEGEYERRIEAGDKSKIEETDPKQLLEVMGNKLDTLYAKRRGGARGPEAQLDRTVQKFKDYKPFAPSPILSRAIANQPPLPGTQIQRNQLEYVLSQAADFDKRITELENSLGLNGNTMPELSDRPAFPVFTTLQTLEQTLGLLGDASTNNLEGAIQQIRKLTADAEQLKSTREDAARAGSVSIENNANAYPDQEAKINALYGTLPSIDKLSPILPLVLERLRTLRLVHTSAWQADEALSELEKRQSKQEEEIKKWEKQLVIVEKDMEKCTETMHNNIKIAGDDVKKIAAKVENLVSGESVE
jgi:nuclear migration protein JNM1